MEKAKYRGRMWFAQWALVSFSLLRCSGCYIGAGTRTVRPAKEPELLFRQPAGTNGEQWVRSAGAHFICSLDHPGLNFSPCCFRLNFRYIRSTSIEILFFLLNFVNLMPACAYVVRDSLIFSQFAGWFNLT